MGAVKAGYTLWQTGRGWYGSNGKIQFGPIASRAGLLSCIDVQESGYAPEPIAGLPDADLPGAVPLRLCIHCNKMVKETDFIRTKCFTCFGRLP